MPSVVASVAVCGPVTLLPTTLSALPRSMWSTPAYDPCWVPVWRIGPALPSWDWLVSLTMLPCHDTCC